MPICTEWVCGTGRDDISLPGDPNNNSLLHVKPVYGGNQLTWTYPDTNPHAIAYIRVFRGINGQFPSAGLLAIVSANNYLDLIEAEFLREYFYWIQLVSVNGTELEPIGPVAATPLSDIQRIMEYLTGKIDAGLLASSLRTEIGRITSLAGDIDTERAARTLQDAVVAQALENLQSANGRAMTAIADETVNRRAANEALLNHVNVLAAGLDDAQAALLNEEQVRTTQDTALASQIAQAEARVGEQVAAVQTNMSAQIDATNNTVGALWTARLTANGLIGGFGIINNGTTVEAGFDVDRFWVGRTGTDGIKPFIIEGGKVYIASAMIKEGVIGTAQLAGELKSDTYVADAAGWLIQRSGNVEFYNIKARGDIEATALKAATGTFKGALEAATGTFKGALQAASGSFAGDISAATGHFTGTVDIKTAQIDTLMIKGQAVTLPISAGRTTDSRSSIVTPSFTLTETTPVAVVIEINSRYEQPTPSDPSNSNGEMYVRRGGTTLRTFPVPRVTPLNSADGWMAHACERSACILETLPAGTYSYSIDCGLSHLGAGFSGSILVIICKR